MAPLAWALTWLALSAVITLAFALGAAVGRRKAIDELAPQLRDPRRLPYRHIVLSEAPTPTSR